MRTSAVAAAVAALMSSLAVASSPAQAPSDGPQCAPPLVGQVVFEDGRPVFRCVLESAASAGSAASQFQKFVVGNIFRRGKAMYTFCAGGKYRAASSRGTFKIVAAKRVKRSDGMTTITAKVVLRPRKGSRRTLPAVLANTGVKLGGSLFGFGGPAPQRGCGPN